MANLLDKLVQIVGTRYARYAQSALARPRTWAFGLALICLPALVLDVQFFGHVRTGLQDLLPDDAPSVQAINRIHDRLGGQSHLTVIATSNDPEQNRALIRELGGRLDAEHLPLVRSVQWNVTAEREWVSDHGALLMDRPDFDELSDLFDREIQAHKRALNPFAFDPDDSVGASRTQELKDKWQALQDRLDKEGQSKDRFPNGFLESQQGKVVVLLVWFKASDLEIAPAQALMRAVEKDVAEVGPKYPSVRIAYNGEVPTLIEEHDAVLADLSLSTIVVFFLVGLLISLYFRSLRAVLTVVTALLPGLAFTFAIGRLTVGSLNSNSAFLGSIIAGNGINYPLLLLAYYRVSPPKISRARAYRLCAWQALPGTFGAAATASAAYGGLAAAHFRGFSEFGWLGGLGMLTTWLFTFATMPIAIGLFDPPRRSLRVEPEARFAAWFYRSLKWPRLGAIAFVALALVLSSIGIQRAIRGGLYELDINILRDRESFASGSASWDGRMNQLFGVWLNPIAALVEKPEQREAAASALRQTLVPQLAERVDTIESIIPPRAEQDRRLAKLRRAKRLLSDLSDDQLPPRAKSFVDRWLADRDLKPIELDDAPSDLTHQFRELDGRVDRTVLSYPSLKINYNDARNVLRFADELHHAEVPEGTVTGGSFLFMAEIIRLVEQEAPGVVGVVCLLVALALVPIFLRRLRRIPVCVITIAAVAISAQSIMLAFGVRVNMFNFAAVPITIGVGSDYIVNLYGAMDAFSTDARHAAARMGGAILLCSLTTVVGYLSLVFARSGALRTFGWAAVLGEVMAISTVLLVVPALARPRPTLVAESTQQAA